MIMPLPIYRIKYDRKYFKGVSDQVIGKTADRNQWYAVARDKYALEFTSKKEEAKIIEGNSNLMSFMKKILEHTQDKTISFNKLIVDKIGED